MGKNQNNYMKFFFTIVLIHISALGFTQIPTGYYNSATGTGYTLKTQLHNIIDNHSIASYSSLWNYYDDTDLDSDGYIWDMYSENPGGTDPYNYTFSSDQCGNYSGEGSCYNREHSFPQSWFNSGAPMSSDIFHVIPTDGYVNGQRGNLPYGEVDNPTWTSQNGSKKGPGRSGLGYSGTVFEPIDEFKGDFARIYFYMATRYEDVIAGWPGSSMLNGTNDQVFSTWALDMLKDWHTNDPVSQKEIDRNDYIYYNIQGNRNPFVDNPNYVFSIWGGNSTTNYCQVSQNASICDGDSYLWNGMNLTNPGQYVDTTAGNTCDTITTLTLSVNNINTSVSQQGNVLQSSTSGATYQWIDCQNGFSSINDETSQQFSPSQNGYYAVEITMGNCIDTSTCFEFIIPDSSNVGISKKLFSSKVNVYPNPIKNILSVECNDKISSITIYSLLGDELLQTNNQKINISHLKSGIYILSLDVNSTIYNYKIIKE